MTLHDELSLYFTTELARYAVMRPAAFALGILLMAIVFHTFVLRYRTMAKTYCSGIPRMKLSIETCCEAHDRAYTAGASGTRAEADLALYHCLAPARPLFAHVVWLGVRALGWAFFRRGQ